MQEFEIQYDTSFDILKDMEGRLQEASNHSVETNRTITEFIPFAELKFRKPFRGMEGPFHLHYAMRVVSLTFRNSFLV
jgi:hypothetical protein